MNERFQSDSKLAGERLARYLRSLDSFDRDLKSPMLVLIRLLLKSRKLFEYGRAAVNCSVFAPRGVELDCFRLMRDFQILS